MLVEEGSSRLGCASVMGVIVSVWWIDGRMNENERDGAQCSPRGGVIGREEAKQTMGNNGKSENRVGPEGGRFAGRVRLEPKRPASTNGRRHGTGRVRMGVTRLDGER